jgi:ankyrin repeat protein
MKSFNIFSLHLALGMWKSETSFQRIFPFPVQEQLVAMGPADYYNPDTDSPEFNVNSVDPGHGKVPLILATISGNTSAIDKLLEAKANLEAFDKSCTALCYAATGTDVSVAKKLLDAKANMQVSMPAGKSPMLCDLFGKTFYVINPPTMNRPEMMRLLLDGNADLKQQTAIGQNHLFYAIQGNSKPNVELLLERKVPCYGAGTACSKATTSVLKGETMLAWCTCTLVSADDGINQPLLASKADPLLKLFFPMSKTNVVAINAQGVDSTYDLNFYSSKYQVPMDAKWHDLIGGNLISVAIIFDAYACFMFMLNHRVSPKIKCAGLSMIQLASKLKRKDFLDILVSQQ